MNDNKKNNNDWFVSGYDSLHRPVYKKKNNSQGKNHATSQFKALKNDFDINTHRIDKIPLDAQTERILGVLYDSDYEPYLVGGKIRDHIFGKDNKDIDIEVYKVKNTNKLIETLEKTGAQVDTVGQSFGVIKVLLDGKEFDISLPRKDSLKKDGVAHRDIHVEVCPDLTIEEASKRRDFTMNALMYSPQDEKILDPHGGIEDIENGILSAVDENTFIADPLRALRGVQFASRFDLDLDDKTIEICRNMTWSNLSKERIQGELHKLLSKSENLHQGVSTLYDIGWNDLTPHLTKNLDNPIDQNFIRKIYNYNIPQDYKIALVTNYMDNHYSTGQHKLSEDLRLTGKQNKVFNKIFLKNMHNQSDASMMRRHFYDLQIPSEFLDDFSEKIGIKPAPHLWQDTPTPYTVNGNYLISLGLQPGVKFKKIIDKTCYLEDNGVKLTEHMINQIIKEA